MIVAFARGKLSIGLRSMRAGNVMPLLLVAGGSTANGMRLTIRATSNTAIELATVGLFSTNANAVFRGLAIYDTAP